MSASRALQHIDSIEKLDPSAIGALLTAAADVTIILNSGGVVTDAVCASGNAIGASCKTWIGRPWLETVTPESRAKIESLLAEAVNDQSSTSRQVNHPSPTGADVPILYSTVRVGGAGDIIAVGRNLSDMAALQQRLLDAQISLERDYSRLRHAETRYRLLFQLAAEAVLIVDADSRKVVEANPAAVQMLGAGATPASRGFPDGFDRESVEDIEALLARVRAVGGTGSTWARSVNGEQEFMVSAALFRQDNAAHFLIRLSPPTGATQDTERGSALLEVLEGLPDAFVVTDLGGHILYANRAFTDLAEMVDAEQLREQSLDRWLGRPGVDLKGLLNNVRQHGAVRSFSTKVRGELGATTDIELSAVAVENGDRPCIGFSLRSVAPRLSGEVFAGGELPRTVEQLTELVGRVPLKDVVREATDLIERMCIEAALVLTDDNRASAADMLGLSRQSLYMKLRRYGIGALGAPTTNDQAGKRKV